MPAAMTIEVSGLKDALKTLNKIDPTLRRQITRDYKEIVKPVITDAKSRIPSQPPLSGMARSWTTASGWVLLPWVPGHPQKIEAKINTRAIKEFRGMKQNVGTFSIQWKTLTGTMFDMSANGRLGGALSARFGKRSRVMWPAWEKSETEVLEKMRELVDKVNGEVNSEVNRYF